jgi:hypothetical protein
VQNLPVHGTERAYASGNDSMLVNRSAKEINELHVESTLVSKNTYRYIVMHGGDQGQRFKKRKWLEIVYEARCEEG